MGAGNVCTFGDYEGLYYVDRDYLDVYSRIDDEGVVESRLRRDLDYDEFSDGDFNYDLTESQFEMEEFKDNFIKLIKKRFSKFWETDQWISRDRHAILENGLFYICFEDNQWAVAVELIQKEDPYGCITGLQTKHFRKYLDAIRDILLDMYGEVGTYNGPWTHGVIKKGENS